MSKHRKLDNAVFRIRSYALLQIAALLAVSGVAKAAIHHWSGDGEDNVWQNPANWTVDNAPSDTAPTNTDDRAIFNTGTQEPVVVDFTGSFTNENLRIHNANVVFDMNGHTYGILVPDSPASYITEAAGQTGTLKIVNGTLAPRKNPENKNAYPYIYLGQGAGSVGTLIVSGEDAEYLQSTMRLNIGQNVGSTGVLIVADGALAKITGGTFYPGNSGYGKLVVSNATLTSGLFVSSVNLGESEVLLTGAEAVYNTSATEPVVGGKAESHMVIEKGAQFMGNNLVIARDSGVEASVTVTGAGSALGKRVTTDARHLTAMTVGGTGRYSVAISPQNYGDGGVGTLNVLDGGLVWDSERADPYFFYIGSGSRLRMRNAEIRWCKSSAAAYRRSPFLFRKGSFYTVELTANTAELTAETPLIWSGATLEDRRTNIIENATLEVELAEGFVPEFNSVYRIFRYDGDLEGAFDGLPDGKEFFVDGHRFRINYGAGTADDIILTALPPEGSVIVIR